MQPSTVLASDAAHPGALEALDRPYFAPWGRAEIVRSTAWAALATVAVGLAAGLHSSWWAVLGVPLAAIWAFLVLFFRNPRRATPTAEGILVAPADGTVWDVEEVSEPEFIGAPAVRIGIFLSVFNVHVNRSPCSSRVEWTRYRPGKYLDARSSAAGTENESNTIALVVAELGAASGARVLVRQVSGAIARRIVCPLKPGDRVRRGGLIGMIKYGSRTEVWLPARTTFHVSVAKGDRVVGGETVIARFQITQDAEAHGDHP